MIADSFRKAVIALEIKALVRTLSESAGSINEPPPEFSKEALVELSLEELASIKDDLRDAVRSLGGGRNGR
jgi:hypothetical protein